MLDKGLQTIDPTETVNNKNCSLLSKHQHHVTDNKTTTSTSVAIKQSTQKVNYP